MTSSPRPSILPLVLLTALAARLAAQSETPCPPAFAGVERFVENGLRQGLSPSVAIGVIQNDRVVWAKGYGRADIAAGRPATADSIYWLASISKTLTATGLMVLVDRGLIDLDQPVNRYLPGTELRARVGSADDMTVRRLANHTSGLPLHWNFFYDGVQPPSRDETIRRYGFAAYPPGDRVQYSNLAFGVLDYVVQTVSKRPWRDFMVDEVFDPIGMTHTYDGVRPGAESYAAQPYFRGAGGRWLAVAPYRFDHPGASAIWSSVHDLLRFARLHYGNGVIDGKRVLSEAAAREMRRPTSTRRGAAGFGVAWMVDTARGRPCIRHSGGMPGVSTMLQIWPEQRTATVVLTNTSQRTMTNEVTGRLARVLFPEVAKPASGAGDAKAAETAAAKPEQTAPAEVKGSWRGAIAHWDGGDIPIEIEVTAADHATIRFGTDEPRELHDVKAANGRLNADIEARIETQKSFHSIPELDLRLERHGDVLRGVTTARVENYFALSFWTELRRRAE